MGFNSAFKGLMMLPLQDSANNTNKTSVQYRPIFKKLQVA